MAIACIAYDNKARGITPTVPGALAEAPAAKFATPHVAEKCRVNSNSIAITWDLGAAYPIDTFALMGLLQYGSADDLDFRLRADNTDGTVGDIIDTGAGGISGTPYYDADFEQFIWLRSSPSAAARYVRFDATGDTDIEFIEAGVPFIGVRSQFAVNFSTPFGTSYQPRTEDAIGEGGQTFEDEKLGYVGNALQFDMASEAERNGFLKELGLRILKRKSGGRDFPLISDPDSTNYSRDFKWGYHEGALQLTQNQNLVPPIFSVTLNHRERL